MVDSTILCVHACVYGANKKHAGQEKQALGRLDFILTGGRQLIVRKLSPY